MKTGKLFLIPTTLGDNQALVSLPTSVYEKVAVLDFYIAENEKTARKFIKQLAPEKKQAELSFNILNKHTDPLELQHFLDKAEEGFDIGLLSEAGCPGIADPGAEIVKLAHQKDIKVVPLVGPSSILLTMMASGLNGQNFTFHGYLPIQKQERKQFIRKLESLSVENQQAQIFIETPYRNEKLFADLLSFLHPSTQLCIGCDVTLTTEYIKTKPIHEWKKTKIDIHKRPAIFIIQK